MAALTIAGRLTPPNIALREACAPLGIHSRLLPPELAAERARPGEIVLGRVDVLPSLEGPEPGLDALRRLERSEERRVGKECRSRGGGEAEQKGVSKAEREISSERHEWDV